MPTIHEHERSFHPASIVLLHSIPYTIHAKFSHRALPVIFFPTLCGTVHISRPYSSPFPGHRVGREPLTLIPTVPLIPASMRGQGHVSPSASRHFVYPHNHSPFTTDHGTIRCHTHTQISLPLNDDVGYRCHFFGSVLGLLTCVRKYTAP